jgi:hypothetical protein
MSYINFSLTHSFGAAGGIAEVLPRTEKISTGFSREGGRVEYVRQSTQSDPLATPRTFDAKLTPSLTKAADGVRNAVQAGTWVQDVVIDHGDGAQPNTVSWTYRDGRSERGLSGSLPAPIQSVIDAAKLLEDVTNAQLVSDGS